MAGKIEQFKIANEQLENIDNLAITSLQDRSYGGGYILMIGNDDKKQPLDDSILSEVMKKYFGDIKKDIKMLYEDKLDKLHKEALLEAEDFFVKNTDIKKKYKKKIWDYIDLE